MSNNTENLKRARLLQQRVRNHTTGLDNNRIDDILTKAKRRTNELLGITTESEIPDKESAATLTSAMIGIGENATESETISNNGHETKPPFWETGKPVFWGVTGDLPFRLVYINNDDLVNTDLHLPARLFGDFYDFKLGKGKDSYLLIAIPALHNSTQIYTLREAPTGDHFSLFEVSKQQLEIEPKGKVIKWKKLQKKYQS